MTESRGTSLNDVYIGITDAFQHGLATPVVGRQQGTIQELRDVDIIIENPRCNLLTVPFRSLSRKYAAGEFAMFMGMHDDVDSFAFYAKRWQKLASSDGEINSAYGKRIFSPDYPDYGKGSRFDYALSQLVANPETKNAVVMMRDDTDMRDGLKDRCCTLYFQFFIRDGRLDMTTVMRSTDFWFGLPYDVFWYTTVMQRMLYLYNTTTGKSVTLGRYTHTCASLHVYASEWKQIMEAELPSYYDKNKEYTFPVWDAHTEEELERWLEWEESYRTGTQSLADKAKRLRDMKFHPFLETMGSFLVNTVKTRYATKEDVLFFNLCMAERKLSACLDRKVGAVLVDKNGNYVTGHNFVHQCNMKCEDKVTRICDVRHAEVSALKNAKDYDLVPVKAYVSLYPCLPCMTALTEAGVTEIIVLGFSHKGATGTVTLIDPAFTKEIEE